MISEVFSGTYRPRHQRAKSQLAQLCRDEHLGYNSHEATRFERATLRARTYRQGYRSLRLAEQSDIVLIHHAIDEVHPHQLLEIDLPLGFHNYSEALFRRSRLKVREMLESSRVKNLIVFSEWAQKVFEFHYGPEVARKSRVVYPLPGSFGKPITITDRQNTFVFVSNSFQLKGGPQVLSAFGKLLKQEGTEPTLTVVTNLQEAASCLGRLDQPNVKWIESNISEHQVRNLLDNSMCLVHPSLSDSFGVVALEAVAAGCAVICTDIASFPEIVNHGRNGYIIDAPVSPVAGYIPMEYYLKPSRMARLIECRDLSLFSHEIMQAMSWVIESDSRLLGIQTEAIKIQQNKFSVKQWESRMKPLLFEA